MFAFFYEISLQISKRIQNPHKIILKEVYMTEFSFTNPQIFSESVNEFLQFCSLICWSIHNGSQVNKPLKGKIVKFSLFLFHIT